MTGAPASGTLDLDPPARRYPISIVHSVPGRLRLRLEAPGEEIHLKAAAGALEAAGGVRRVVVHPAARSVIVEYERSRTDANKLFAAALSAVPEDHGFKTVEAEMSLPVPVGRVWRVIADPRYLALHLPQSVSVTSVRNPVHWLVEFTVFGRRFKVEVRVVERVHEQRLVIRAEGSFTARITVTLQPEGEITRVRERVDYHIPAGVFGSVLGRFSSRRLHKGLLSHLASLAALAADR